MGDFIESALLFVLLVVLASAGFVLVSLCLLAVGVVAAVVLIASIPIVLIKALFPK
jgi:hypothetical protein